MCRERRPSNDWPIERVHKKFERQAEADDGTTTIRRKEDIRAGSARARLSKLFAVVCQLASSRLVCAKTTI